MFEKLYKEFEDECEGTVYMMVNNPNRYKKWYKERVEQLCLDYHNSITPDTGKKEKCTCGSKTIPRVVAPITEIICRNCGLPRH